MDDAALRAEHDRMVQEMMQRLNAPQDGNNAGDGGRRAAAAGM